MSDLIYLHTCICYNYTNRKEQNGIKVSIKKECGKNSKRYKVAGAVSMKQTINVFKFEGKMNAFALRLTHVTL